MNGRPLFSATGSNVIALSGGTALQIIKNACTNVESVHRSVDVPRLCDMYSIKIIKRFVSLSLHCIKYACALYACT